MPELPPPPVLSEFGAGEDCRAIPFGEGRSVRCGDLVLKPVDDSVEAEWVAGLLAAIEENGFRVAHPVLGTNGRYVVDGWTASKWLAGEHGDRPRWMDLWSASRAFHAAIADTPHPGFIDRREHRWAYADRVAWQEAAPRLHPRLTESFERLATALAPIDETPQIVHGDLSGNVLYDLQAPPAIIDISPFFRPVVYAEAIAVVDGFLWYGADLTAAKFLDPRLANQALVRAALFRLIAHSEWMLEQGSASDADADEEPLSGTRPSALHGVFVATRPYARLRTDASLRTPPARPNPRRRGVEPTGGLRLRTSRPVTVTTRTTPQSESRKRSYVRQASDKSVDPLALRHNWCPESMSRWQVRSRVMRHFPHGDGDGQPGWLRQSVDQRAAPGPASRFAVPGRLPPCLQRNGFGVAGGPAPTLGCLGLPACRRHLGDMAAGPAWTLATASD